MNVQETGYFESSIKFLSNDEQASSLLSKIAELSPSWVQPPRLLTGPLFDDSGPERYFTIEFVSDPEVKYVSGWDMIQLCKNQGCHHEETWSKNTSLATKY